LLHAAILAPRILKQIALEMWWHKRRNQFSSFGETDEFI
jgi:hypothetical protein